MSEFEVRINLKLSVFIFQADIPLGTKTGPGGAQGKVSESTFPHILPETRESELEVRTLSQLNDTNGIQMLAKFKSGIKHFCFYKNPKMFFSRN